MSPKDQSKMLEEASGRSKRPPGNSLQEGDRVKVTNGRVHEFRGRGHEIISIKGMVRIITTIFGRAYAAGAGILADREGLSRPLLFCAIQLLRFPPFITVNERTSWPRKNITSQFKLQAPGHRHTCASDRSGPRPARRQSASSFSNSTPPRPALQGKVVGLLWVTVSKDCTFSFEVKSRRPACFSRMPSKPKKAAGGTEQE